MYAVSGCGKKPHSMSVRSECHSIFLTCPSPSRYIDAYPSAEKALESVYIHSPVPIHLHSAPKYISHRRKPATSPAQAPHILRTSAISGILAAVEAAAYIITSSEGKGANILIPMNISSR
ncbi:uncharacterized protein ARMOST_02299 [Armillaria ostoyae]|uniref:Uncharacterized protein n=1 Tax=Armillaria ostoyae TaxID=47428 RepID=A0A284QRB5_ARMOS|nr:uncharacterized protein ARMOST_02299 [Armillaria ostoyae]